MNPSKRFFSLSKFRKHDLPNLSINIWEYSDCRHGDCFICKQYREWCITAAKEKWCDIYHDFDKVINQLITRNKKWQNFSRISSADRNIVFTFIKKKWYCDDDDDI